ncbi:MAG: hypothetical protein ACM3NV_09580 [Syntrophothermus sp.]
MKNTTWKITTMKDGAPVASVEGVGHDNAVAAIEDAMRGRDPLARIARRGAAAETKSETLAAAA